MYSVRDKRVSVAGSSGFLGRHIIEQLLAQGAIVRGLSLQGRGNIQPDIESLHVDLRDSEMARSALQGQDALIIAAANTSGAQVMANNPLAHLLDNTLINGSLLRAAVLNGLSRVLFISSSTVYPNGASPMAEADFTGTYFSSYETVATMKKYFEDSCIQISRHSQTECVIVRPGNAYGPFDHFDSPNSHVIPALVSKVHRSTSALEVWGDGKDIKNFIFVSDLAQGIVAALQNGEPGQIYNLGGPEEISIDSVIEILLSCAGKDDLEVIYDPSKPSMIPVRRINSDRAAKEIGFRAQTSIQEGLRLTYDWYASQVP